MPHCHVIQYQYESNRCLLLELMKFNCKLPYLRVHNSLCSKLIFSTTFIFTFQHWEVYHYQDIHNTYSRNSKYYVRALLDFNIRHFFPIIYDYLQRVPKTKSYDLKYIEENSAIRQNTLNSYNLVEPKNI